MCIIRIITNNRAVNRRVVKFIDDSNTLPNEIT